MRMGVCVCTCKPHDITQSPSHYFLFIQQFICRLPFTILVQGNPTARLCVYLCEWLSLCLIFIYLARRTSTHGTHTRCICVFALLLYKSTLLFLIYFVDFNFALRCAFSSRNNDRTALVAHTPGVTAHSAHTAASTSSHLSRAQRLCCV